MRTKTGKLLAPKTFATFVYRDKECRRYAVELGLFDDDLRLAGKYINYCGYTTLEEARRYLKNCVIEKMSPFVINTKAGLIDYIPEKRGPIVCTTE